MHILDRVVCNAGRAVFYHTGGKSDGTGCERWPPNLAL